MQSSEVAKSHNNFSRPGNRFKIQAGQESRDAIAAPRSHDHINLGVMQERIEIIQAVEIGPCKILPSVLAMGRHHDAVTLFGQIQNRYFQRTGFGNEARR